MMAVATCVLTSKHRALLASRSGNTTLGGEDVRIWALHLNNGTFHAYWYDTVADRTVRRIAFGDFGVLDVVSIAPLEGGEDENAHLFMAPVPGVTVRSRVMDIALRALTCV